MADKNSLLIKINGDAKTFQEAVKTAKKETQELSDAIGSFGTAATVTFAAVSASIYGFVNTYADYETALVGVGKTTDITGEALKNFGRQFQKMSSEIPVSTNELLGIAQAAGQLGVKGEANLLKFTDTVAKLGVATDLSGEEAATALTRILNVTKESVESIDVLGSVIVALGNNFAATESEITRVATEVTRSTAVFGVTAAQGAALGAALKSVGVQAELGGSAVGRTMRAIDKALREGGTSLENLSKITGMTGDQLKQTFEKDAITVFQKFVEGLGRIEASGGSSTEALASFKLRGEEILKVIPVLANNSQLLGQALNMAATETKNATALNEEASRAFSTLNSETQKMKNAFLTFASRIGESLAPAVTTMVQSFTGLFNVLGNLPESVYTLIAAVLRIIATFTSLVATTALVTKAMVLFRTTIRGVRAVLSVLNITLKAGAVSAKIFWGAMTGGITLLISFLPEAISLVKQFFGYLKKNNTQSLDDVDKKIKDISKNLENLRSKKTDKNTSPYHFAAIQQYEKQLEELKKVRKKMAAEQEKIQETKTAKTKSQDNSYLQGVEKQNAKETELTEKSVQDRINAKEREAQYLKEIQDAKNEGYNATEIAFLQKQQERREAYAQAQTIKNEEEREAALAALAEKYEEQLRYEDEFNARKEQRARSAAERKKAFEEGLKELEQEEQEALTEMDKEKAEELFLSEQDVRQQHANEELKQEADKNKRYLEMKVKHGKAVAELDKIMNSDAVKNMKEASSQLIALTNSKNSKLKEIGKAAARVDAAIATAKGAISAYAALSGIPIVGPSLGIAAAAALTAYGVERQAQISAMKNGGFVAPTGASGGRSDRVPTMLEPGEFVVPKRHVGSFMDAVGVPNTQEGQLYSDEDNDKSVVEIVIQDRAAEVIALEQRSGKALGIIGG